MKHIFVLFFLPLFLQAYNPVQNDRAYQAHLNLTKIEDGRIKVTVVVPVLETDFAIYNMPKMVPGTYKIYDYGQFVHQFKAFDSKGDSLKVERLNTNQWKISNAQELYKLEYWASASYDKSSSFIFAPAGTAIGEDAFLLNNFGFIGYIEGLKNTPFKLEISKPESLYATTALPEVSRAPTQDNFEAENYFELHDCPIMYAAPDTATLFVAGMPITIGVYSKEKTISAVELKVALKPVFEAAATYLGGTLPTEKYVVIVYALSLRKSLGGMGALEHNTSTVVNLADLDAEWYEKFGMGDVMQLYRNVVAHEFMHIVTPLNIHGKEILDFDFINPTMGEHLWLYEGVTEYNGMVSQTRAGVTTLQDFVTELEGKFAESRAYNDAIPFTQMSKYSLSYFSNQYNNVYEKGALIGLATDLKLRSLSNGEFGLINLLEEMWQTYGADTFFVEDDLFRLLVEKSYPEMEEFFVRHIASAQPLPLQELLAEVGIDYVAEQEIEAASFGDLAVSPSRKTQGVAVVDFDKKSPFIKELKIEIGDVLLEINGNKIDAHSASYTLNNVKRKAKKGDTITMLVERQTGDGKTKTLTLKARAVTQLQTVYDSIIINENLTDKQRTLRHFWINN